MLIYNDDNGNSLLTLISTYFSEKIINQDLSAYYNIYLSDNIKNDYSLFDNSVDINGDGYAGITILPSDNSSTITILISYPNPDPSVILHELAHMYDMVLFAEKFCNNNLSKVKCHTYYQTFIYWSEFHVKQIDIPYLYILLEFVNGKTTNFLDTFQSRIKDFYFPGYTQKFISKKDNFAMRDIMWYLGELVVCNKYKHDDENIYSIPADVVNIFPPIQVLYEGMLQCLDFESFANNIESLNLLFFGKI